VKSFWICFVILTPLAIHSAPFRSWINIKVSYQAFRGRDKKARQSGMAEMLRELRLPLVGKHHCGLDDARNIASILIELLGNGAALDVNGSY
jgi:ERI1 exoribonuclease 3